MNVFISGLSLSRRASFRLLSLLGERVFDICVSVPLVAHQDYLDLERDGLWIERQRAHQAVGLAQGFEAYPVAQQGELESLPGEGLGQQTDDIEQGVTAVGAV